jgi:cellulose synthase operon protein C
VIGMTDVPAGAESVNRLEALVGRMASGEPLAAILRDLIPNSWAPVLSRVAVAGRFDQEVYDGLLAPGGLGSPPALSALADVGLLVPVPGRPGWLSMPAEDRLTWAARLAEAEQRALENRLGQFYLKRGERLEAMPHLLNGSRQQGRELLESLLAEVDAQLNLPRWQDVLQAAQGGILSLGADLAEFIADHTAYLNARSMSLTDYYQSALFLEPPGFRADGLEFTTSQGERVWHIVGPGGAGKTMQLRWLVSRLWVPQPARVPCARVDFDAVEPAMCARYPFLVFIIAADQLGRQLPHNPFSHLLRAYEPWLRWATHRAGRDGAEALATQAAHAGQEVPWLFADACQATTDTAVVLILDTIEELSLRYPAETTILLRQLRGVLGRVPGLRLVFSGRYEIPAVRQIFAGVRPHLVRPFTPEQSRAYLGQIRGITDEGRQDELIQRAAGFPYVLAMYADLITADPEVALDDIGLDLEPRLVYLAERIIDRIPEPLVRWLLRYGWVPRRLTRAYVREVLAPFVIRISLGDRTLDDPMLDPITAWLGRPLFPTDLPDLQDELDRAWAALKTYASDSSWVTGVRGDPDTLLLKAEMLAPMRAVLASRPVLRELHRQSAEFYRARAETDTGSRSRWLGETMYHLAQASAPDLAPRWQEFVDRAREAGDYSELADLGTEVVAGEHDGGILLPRPLRIEAHLWRAYAAQAIVVRRLQGGVYAGWREDPLWADIRREHEVATELAEDELARWADSQPGERSLILAQAERLVRGALAFADADPQATWELAETMMLAPGDIGICALALQVAAAPVTRRDTIGVQQRLTDRELEARRPASAAASAAALAVRLTSAGQVDRAVSLVGKVSAETAQLGDAYLDLLIEQGTPSAARSAQPNLRPDQVIAVGWRRVQAYLALRKPEQALTLLRDSQVLFRRRRDAASQLRERASWLELTGLTHGVLLRLDAAVAAFEESASLWLELGHPDGHVRSRRHHAEVLLHAVGDVGQALTLLDGLSDQLDDREESIAALRLKVQALAQAGQPQPAARLADELLLRSEQAAQPQHRDRVLAAIAGLIATDDVERYGPPLLHSLRRVRPGTARLRLLEQLKWRAPGVPLTGEVLSEVAAADPAAAPGDLAVHDLQRAYVAKATGDPRVQEWLTSALNLAGPSYLACEVLSYFPGQAPAHAAPLAERYLSSQGEEGQTLAAMVHLRQAGRARSSPDEMSRLLDLAGAELDAAGRPSRWLAECYELRGYRAADRGDENEGTRDFQSARLLQERLGNDRAVRALARVLSGARDAGNELYRATPPTAHERETVVRDLLGRRLGPRVDEDAMAAAIARGAEDNPYAHPASGVVRVESPELEVLWPPWELVTDRVYRAQPTAGSVRRDIAWLRWTLAAREQSLSADVRERCRRVVNGQEALTPLLREQVEYAVRAVDIRPRVVIVKGSRSAEFSWGYGHEDRGMNLLSSYRAGGWDAEEFTTDQIRELGAAALVARRPADVIHLTARMETSGTLSWFDTSEENIRTRGMAKGIGTNTGVFATDVVGWLAGISRAPNPSPPPVVVLDPVADPSSARDPRLLAGRNRFAASVYLDGMAMAVLAMGLVGRDPLAAQLAWRSGVTSGDPLEQVVRDIRRRADPDVPPALFAPSSTFTVSQA